MKNIILLSIAFLVSVNITLAQGFELLADIVIKKDYQAIEQLLSEGIDINTQQPSRGTTVLMIASSYFGYEDCVEYLIGKGANVNTKNTDGKTALLWSASNSFENAKVLIAKGAKVNEAANDGMTPFIQAVFGFTSGKVPIEMCELLRDHGANINAELTGRNASGWTALHYAVFNGDTELVEYLIKHGANINKATAEGSTPLFLAKMEDYGEIARILRDAGAKD
jgi:ankyrin repeat protein